VNLTGQQYAIEAGEHQVTVVEVGAGLQRYRHRGVDVTCTYGEDVLPPKACGIVLVPWPNRIRAGKYSFDGVDYQLALTEPAAGNAIHGLGRWARWSVVAHELARVTLRLDVVPQNGYPFPVRAEVTYSVDAQSGLTVTIEATNPGAARAPFGAGSHPYLSTRGHALADTRLRLPASQHLVTDEKGVPVGTRPVAGGEYDLRRGKRLKALRMDDGFTGLPADPEQRFAEVSTPSGGARLWFDTAFTHLQVFTLDALTPQQPGIAIEPMSCAPDAFNTGTGLVVLEPGGLWRGSWGIVPSD
jgi:aldose 1-epimerase